MFNFLNALKHEEHTVCVWSITENVCSVLFVCILLNVTNHSLVANSRGKIYLMLLSMKYFWPYIVYIIKLLNDYTFELHNYIETFWGFCRCFMFLWADPIEGDIKIEYWSKRTDWCHLAPSETLSHELFYLSYELWDFQFNSHYSIICQCPQYATLTIEAF